MNPRLVFPCGPPHEPLHANVDAPFGRNVLDLGNAWVICSGCQPILVVVIAAE